MIPALVNLLIFLIIVALVIGLVFWVCDFLPIPEPFNKFVKGAAIIVGVLIVILLLLQLTGAVGTIAVPKLTP